MYLDANPKYRRNQQFRTLGSSKLGMSCPLRMYDGTLASWSTEGYSFTTNEFPQRTWLNSLCTNVPEDRDPITVKPSQYIQFSDPRVAYNRIYRNAQIDDMMNIAGRFLTTDSVITTTSTPTTHNQISTTNITDARHHIDVSLASTKIIPARQNELTMIIDDSGSIVDECGTTVRLSHIDYEERVYCMSCETSIHDGLMEGIGKSSAKILMTRNRGKRVYGFNCRTSMFILECGEQYGFVPADDELIYSDYPKLNFNGQGDINFNACSRVVFLDAPMGAGKTYVADEYIKSLPSAASVLSVTFRISLAQYLAARLNLNSYLDPNI